MADVTTEEHLLNTEDLEDGEIESDGEEHQVQNEIDREQTGNLPENVAENKGEMTGVYYSKSGKKKKSKNHNKEQKSKEKGKKYRKYPSPPEDDFAGSVEKAIRKALNKNDDGESCNYEEVDERRKHKKRKKYDGKEGASKKRKKVDYLDEVDENEMMCIRGASPVQRQTSSPLDNYQNDDHDSYASDTSHDSREQHPRQQRHRPHQRERKNKNDRDRRRGAHPMQDPDGVCLYYMQGKCHKGDDCIYSHDAQPPRKMELCKFYLMDCCAKRDKCLYMHSDFPCKFYHTGLPCIYKDDCKFAHGKPLSENLKMILLKHIESAPKEILGDFPRLSREGAANMIANTQMKLMQQYSEGENQDKNIPSLFELNIPKPQTMPDINHLRVSPNQMNNEKTNKISPKVRQSRWQNDNSVLNHNNMLHTTNVGTPCNVLSIKNLNGVLTPRQITDLTKMGIDNLDQLGQLTVLQLNSIGITLKQITEIQLNTMSIQKLGLISTNAETHPTQATFLTSLANSKDMDLRVAPVVTATTTTLVTDVAGKDVDMRFQPSSVPVSVSEDDHQEDTKANQSADPRVNRDMIDIDQYTKDALKFVSKDKESSEHCNDTLENEKSFPLEPRLVVGQPKDIDQRVLKFAEDDSSIINKSIESPSIKLETDTDIRFLQPDPLFKNPGKRNRRSTTDDEDNNLLIDEKWYSSDEEKCVKRKSPVNSPVPLSPPHVVALSQVTGTAAVLSKLGDLSKIDISEEVTKLLHTMKNNLHESKPNEKSAEISNIKLKDPRNAFKKSPEHKGHELNKMTSKKQSKVSIYECVEGEPTDGRRRSDVDLRQNDFKLPTFGDTDLRHNASGDIDFRLGLPFKPLPNYTPASEIDGSFNSHPPILYKLLTIDIPRPDYTDIRNSTAKSQALLDPRLRKVFRLSVDESNSDNEKSVNVKPSTAPRVDPRRKQKETNEIMTQEHKTPSLDLQTVLQTSDWYKELSSTQKIFVNQNLASMTSILKQYHQDKMPGKKFDLTSIQSNIVLCNIFTNLGVTLGENGEFSYLPKQKEALLKTPVTFTQNFGMGGNMDANNMNMMNVSHSNMSGIGNMSMNQMSNFNQSFPDPRGGPPPGLLGVAPNIPHNFDNMFGGLNNFGKMPFNNGNDFGNMDMDKSYQRFPNRGGFRGRGNDRWNRGGAPRGHRDRKNYNDRGSWKNERH